MPYLSPIQAALCALYGLALLCGSSVWLGIENATRTHPVSLATFLKSYGAANHFEFTTETMYGPGEVFPTIEVHALPVVESGRDPAFLRRRLPGFVFVASRTVPGLYHLIDRRLERRRTYVLNRRIAEFHYHGNSNGLLQTLADSGVYVSPTKYVILGGGDPLNIDVDARTAVNAPTLTLRELLTEILPPRFSPTRWMASTFVSQDDLASIHLPGLYPESFD